MEENNALPAIEQELVALQEKIKAGNEKKKKKPKTFLPFCKWILDVHDLVLQGMIPGIDMDTAALALLIETFRGEIEDLPCDLNASEDDPRATLIRQKIQVQDRAYEMIAHTVVQSWARVNALKVAYEDRNANRNGETDATAKKWVDWVNETIPEPAMVVPPMNPEEEEAKVPSTAEKTYLEAHHAAQTALAALDQVRREMTEFWKNATVDTPTCTLEALRQQETALMRSAVEAVQYRTVARHRMLDEDKVSSDLPQLPVDDGKSAAAKDDVALLRNQILLTINGEMLRRKAFRNQEVRELVANAVLYETSRVQAAVRTLYKSMLVQVQSCEDDIDMVDQAMRRGGRTAEPLDDCGYSMELRRRQEAFRTIEKVQFK